MIKTKSMLLVSFFLASVFLTGCSFVQVVNTSDLDARVIVTVPESGGGSTRLIESGESVDVFSSMSGSYSVQTIPNDDYRQILLDLQQKITNRLWTERETLTGGDVANLIESINNIDDQLELLAQSGASCQGNLPEYETVVVVLAWDDPNYKWTLSCP